MPSEIKTKEEFAKVLEGATLVRVVKEGKNAKVKARTKNLLYTYKTNLEEADALTKGLKVTVEEFTSTKEDKD